MQQLQGLNFEVDGSITDGDDNEPDSSSTGSESMALNFTRFNQFFQV